MTGTTAEAFRKLLTHFHAGIGNVVKTVSRVFLEALPQHGPQKWRGFCREKRPVRFAPQNRGHRFGDSVALKRLLTCQALIQHAAEGPDVRPLVHGLALGLLRTHVGRRPEDRLPARSSAP